MLSLFAIDPTWLAAHPEWLWWAHFTLLALCFLFCWRFVVWWQHRKTVWPLPETKRLKKQSKTRKIPKLVSQKALSKQLPLFLRTLGSTLKAGYSVPQALIFTAQETEEPLRSKLQAGLRMLEIKQPLESILFEWKAILKVPEFNFLADTLVLQARTGGNLVSVCSQVASLLEERQKLERDVKAFTAQGKLSGILMALLWPISLALFVWLSPSHTEILFNSRPGQILLLVSLCLELIGFFFIWRLIRVKI